MKGFISLEEDLTKQKEKTEPGGEVEKKGGGRG